MAYPEVRLGRTLDVDLITALERGLSPTKT